MKTFWQFVVDPDWQSMETVPKDGTPVVIAIETADFKTGELQRSASEYFWGRMIDFPQEECFVNLHNIENSSLMDERPFVNVQYEYEEYGKKKGSYYRGCRHIGWTRPWKTEIITVFPSENLRSRIHYEITDKHQ